VIDDTETGVLLSVVELFPSCPAQFRPHEEMVPFCFKASEKYSPAAIALTVVTLEISVGDVR
jgi:hypothetical protein